MPRASSSTSTRRKRKKRINKIKPRSRATRFQPLRRIKCYKEVHERIVRGWPISEVARYIQDDQQEYTNVTRATLITTLNEYRNNLPPADIVANTMPTSVAKAAEKVRDSVDEIEAMEELFRLQLERIEIDHNIEKTAKKLFPSMTQEIKTAKDILAELAQIKMDMGLTERNIGKLSVDSTSAEVQLRYGNERMARVLANPESRQRLLGLVKSVVQLDRIKKQEEEGQNGETVLVTVDGEELDLDNDEDLAEFAPGETEAAEGAG